MDRSRAATREVYDEIAAHFDGTRRHPWPEVQAFLAEAAPEPTAASGVGLDVGCGNGRHLAPLAERVEHAVGVDLSTELLGIARDRLAAAREGAGPDADRSISADVALLAGDATALSLADDSVDVAVYVATLHHLPTSELRRRSLDELARVLAPGGVGLVSAWSTEHDRFDADESFDTVLEWELPDGGTVDRFYHVYDPASFEAELDASALSIRDWEVSSGNCYARVGPEAP